MRTLNKNKQTLYHAEYLSETETVRNGLKTGHYVPSYTEPKVEQMNISPAKGYAGGVAFGISTDYSLVAVTDDLSCSMDEYSIVWVGKTPSGGKDDHNYVVVRKSPSLNSISYALQEVTSG